MRTTVLFIAIVVFGSACDTLVDTCVGTPLPDGFCAPAFAPTPGPWRATFVLGDDGCGLDAAPPASDGWTLAASEAGFSFGAGAAADCALAADRSYDCPATALADGLTLAHAGTVDSESRFSGTFTVSGDACTTTGTLTALAAWRIPGEPGACPEDWEDIDVPGTGEQVPVTIENRSDLQLGLYDVTNGGVVFMNPVPAQGVYEYADTLGTWLVLGNGWEESECVYAFQITGNPHVEVFRGE